MYVDDSTIGNSLKSWINTEKFVILLGLVPKSKESYLQNTDTKSLVYTVSSQTGRRKLCFQIDFAIVNAIFLPQMCYST